MGWADEEFLGIDLGDKRRGSRAIRLVERLAERPTASIPGACNGWAETQAAYRFLAGEEYEWMDILEPHRQCTGARMADHPVVLCLQDTTELDFNGQGIAGLGPLSYEAQRGMYLHPTYAVSPAREPLGVLDAWMWAREPKGADATRPGIKESVRWGEGYARVAELAGALPQTRLVYVADRESDIRELMVRARGLGTPADWLLRSQHNHALPEGGRLWAKGLASLPLGEIRFTLPGGRGRTAREVRQELYAQRVALSDGRRGTFEVTCLVAREIGIGLLAGIVMGIAISDEGMSPPTPAEGVAFFGGTLLFCGAVLGALGGLVVPGGQWEKIPLDARVGTAVSPNGTIGAGITVPIGGS